MRHLVRAFAVVGVAVLALFSWNSEIHSSGLFQEHTLEQRPPARQIAQSVGVAARRVDQDFGPDLHPRRRG